ncbi:hypothetical protein LTR72_007231 [Exophiala xenobiotica]|nr:hypothetical protein LTR72_007231 [Exophiala xenobiotica]KAK5290882.1 hypothetical protein LTR14_006389 [Exophiala xenobiotica]KAK5497370.1 hypothetical protein LTR55_001862 [Exophiala xenobiotica]
MSLGEPAIASSSPADTVVATSANASTPLLPGMTPSSSSSGSWNTIAPSASNAIQPDSAAVPSSSIPLPLNQSTSAPSATADSSSQATSAVGTIYTTTTLPASEPPVTSTTTVIEAPIDPLTNPNTTGFLTVASPTLAAPPPVNLSSPQSSTNLGTAISGPSNAPMSTSTSWVTGTRTQTAYINTTVVIGMASPTMVLPISTSSLQITGTQTYTTYINTTSMIEAPSLTMSQSASGTESLSTVGALSEITDPALLSSYQTIRRPSTLAIRPVGIINGTMSSSCTGVNTVTVYVTPTTPGIMSHTVTVTGAAPQVNSSSVHTPTTTGPMAGSSVLESMAMNSSMSILSPIAPSTFNFSSLVAGYRTGHGGPTPASSSTNMATSTPPASLPSSSIARSTHSTMGSAASSVLESSASLNFSALVAGRRTGTQHLQATGTGGLSARSLAMRDTTSIEGPYNFDSILEENKTKKPTRTRTSTSPPKTDTGIFQVRDEHSTSSMGAGAGGQHASLTTKPVAETEPLVMPQRHEDASGSGNRVGEWLRKVSRLFTPARSRQTTFVTVPRASTGRTESLMATKTTQTM